MNHRRTARTLRLLTIVTLLALLIPVALVYTAHHTWINKTPPGAPPVPGARIDHAMAGIGGSKVVMFSGQSAINDTWVYDASLNLEDPETLVLSSVFIQAWGRIPSQ